jgi:hypothetical protein
MKERIIHLIVLLFLSNIVYAQFKGGIDDGSSFNSTSSQNLTPNIFKGGVNDGTSSILGLNQNSQPNIYTGGVNDGISSINANLQNPLPGIYSGGINDGIASINISNQNPQPGIYSGGINDGFNTVLATLQNPDMKIYLGGTNDGVSSFLTSLQNPIPSIYLGGANDGYATIVVLNQNFVAGLPIKLFSFNGKWINNDAVLNWQTNSSIELSRMEVERSVDGGVQFQKIADIMPGSALNKQDYRYTDTGAWNLPPDYLLYRLKLVSNIGKPTYSTIVKLNKDKAAAILTAYPNPTSGNLTLSIQNVPDFTDYGYQLYSIDGKLIQHGVIQSANTSLDLHKYSAGTYQVIIFKKGTIIQKFKIILTH